MCELFILFTSWLAHWQLSTCPLCFGCVCVLLSCYILSVQYFNPHTINSVIIHPSWWCECLPVINMGIFPISTIHLIWCECGRNVCQVACWSCMKQNYPSNRILISFAKMVFCFFQSLLLCMVNTGFVSLVLMLSKGQCMWCLSAQMAHLVPDIMTS